MVGTAPPNPWLRDEARHHAVALLRLAEALVSEVDNNDWCDADPDHDENVCACCRLQWMTEHIRQHAANTEREARRKALEGKP